MRPSVLCPEIHGESGLETRGNIPFPPLPRCVHDYIDALTEQPFHFTTLMLEYFKAAPAQVSIIATSSLTNVALLLINHPECKKYIEKIVIMGGAMGIGRIYDSLILYSILLNDQVLCLGNTGSVAEFNIQIDPEAAHVVFESEIPIFMVPLEVTHTALATPDIIAQIRDIGTDFSTLMTDLLLFFKSTYKEVFFFDDP